MNHNHVTRDIRPEGACPACDSYHEAQRTLAAQRAIATRAGELAQQVAAYAVEMVGPDAEVLRMPEDDAQLARAAFIGRLAEAAIAIANGEKLP